MPGTYPSFINLERKWYFHLLTHKKSSFGKLVCLQVLVLHPTLLQCYLLLLTRIKHYSTCRECTHLQALHALPKSSTWPPPPLPKLVTLSFFLHLFWPLEISFTFCSPSCLLDHLLLWQVLGFGICMWWLTAWQKKTRQLSVDMLQQFVTTQIHQSPHCHKSYRKQTLEMSTAFVKFSDQQVWKLCGWQKHWCTPTQTLVMISRNYVSVVYIDSNHSSLS